MLEYINFKTVVAMNVGVKGAIILQNLSYWIEKNRANEKHFHDGEYWTYNSIKAFIDIFPFWSKRIVERELNKLEEDGYILTGNYNKSPYDRTKWYALTEKSKCYFKVPSHCMNNESTEWGNGKNQMVKWGKPNGEMKTTKRGNENHQTVEPIPCIYHNNTNNNTNSGCSCSNNNTSLYGSNTVEIYSKDDNNYHNDHPLVDNDLAMIIQFYEDNFSTVSSYIAEQIESLKKEYGVDWVLKSMEKAVVSGRDKCNLRYVEGILKSWKNRGVAKPWETQLTPQQRKEADFVKRQEIDAQKRAELAKQKELEQKKQREQMEKDVAEGLERQKAELEQLKHDDPEKWLRIEINRLNLMLRMTKPAPDVKAAYLKKVEELEKQLQDLIQS